MGHKDASLINRILCVTLSALLVCTVWWPSSAWGFDGRSRNILGDEGVPMAATPDTPEASEVAGGSLQDNADALPEADSAEVAADAAFEAAKELAASEETSVPSFAGGATRMPSRAIWQRPPRERPSLVIPLPLRRSPKKKLPRLPMSERLIRLNSDTFPARLWLCTKMV